MNGVASGAILRGANALCPPLAGTKQNYQLNVTYKVGITKIK